MKLRIRESNAKYKEVKVLQGYFGKWEDLEEADADNAEEVRELKDDLKSYKENDPRPYRIVTRKVENPDYDATKVRKSSAKGFAIIVDKIQRGRNQGREVYYTDKSNINYAYLEKQGYISYLPRFGVTLYADGYSFIQNNMELLTDYSTKPYYSQTAFYLSDGTRIKDTLFVTYSY